jgi:DNA-binding response OmpR family regulator
VRRGCLLYLEDEETIRRNFTELFQLSGYNVIATGTVEQAASIADTNDIELAILDVELNGDPFAGIGLCKALRTRFPALPIVLLSAHSEAAVQEVAFSSGADEYLDKKSTFSLLMARINRLMERWESLSHSKRGGRQSLTRGLVFKGSSQSAYWFGHRLNLNEARFSMLKALYENQGEVMSTSDLMGAMNVVVEPNTIVAHIKYIRDEFLALNPSFDQIKTVRGKGYTWIDND